MSSKPATLNVGTAPTAVVAATAALLVLVTVERVASAGVVAGVDDAAVAAMADEPRTEVVVAGVEVWVGKREDNPVDPTDAAAVVVAAAGPVVVLATGNARMG